MATDKSRIDPLLIIGIDNSEAARVNADFGETRAEFERELVSACLGQGRETWGLPAPKRIAILAVAKEARVVLSPSTDMRAASSVISQLGNAGAAGCGLGSADSELSFAAGLRLAKLVAKREAAAHVVLFIASPPRLDEELLGATPAEWPAGAQLTIAVLCPPDELGSRGGARLEALVASVNVEGERRAEAGGTEARPARSRVVYMPPPDCVGPEPLVLDACREGMADFRRALCGTDPSLDSQRASEEEAGRRGRQAGGGAAPEQYAARVTALLQRRSGVLRPANCRQESLDSLGHLSTDGMLRSWLPNYANLSKPLRGSLPTSPNIGITGWTRSSGSGTGRMCFVQVYRIDNPQWQVLLDVRAGRMLPEQARPANESEGNDPGATGPEQTQAVEEEPSGARVAALPVGAMTGNQRRLDAARSISTTSSRVDSFGRPDSLLPVEAMAMDLESLGHSGSEGSCGSLSDLELPGVFHVGEAPSVHPTLHTVSQIGMETWVEGSGYVGSSGDLLPIGETATLWGSACHTKGRQGSTNPIEFPVRAPQNSPGMPKLGPYIDTCPSTKVWHCGRASVYGGERSGGGAAPGIDSWVALGAAFHDRFSGRNPPGISPAIPVRVPPPELLSPAREGMLVPLGGLQDFTWAWTRQNRSPLIGESSLLEFSHSGTYLGDRARSGEVLRSEMQHLLKSTWPVEEPHQRGPVHRAGHMDGVDMAVQAVRRAVAETPWKQKPGDAGEASARKASQACAGPSQKHVHVKSAEGPAIALLEQQFLHQQRQALCSLGSSDPRNGMLAQSRQQGAEGRPNAAAFAQRRARQASGESAESREHWRAVEQIRNRQWAESDKFDKILEERGIAVPPPLSGEWGRKSAKVAAMANSLRQSQRRLLMKADATSGRPPVGLQLLAPLVSPAVPTFGRMPEPGVTEARSRSSEQASARRPDRVDHMGVCGTCGKCRMPSAPPHDSSQDTAFSHRFLTEFRRVPEPVKAPHPEPLWLRGVKHREEATSAGQGKPGSIPCWALPQLPIPMYGEKADISIPREPGGIEPRTAGAPPQFVAQPAETLPHGPTPFPVTYSADARKPPVAPARPPLPKTMTNAPDLGARRAPASQWVGIEGRPEDHASRLSSFLRKLLDSPKAHKVRARCTKLKAELQSVRSASDAAAFAGKLLDLAYKDQVPLDSFGELKYLSLFPRKSDVPPRPSSAPELLTPRPSSHPAADLFPVRIPIPGPRLAADLRKGSLLLMLAADGSGTLRLRWRLRAATPSESSTAQPPLVMFPEREAAASPAVEVDILVTPTMRFFAACNDSVLVVEDAAPHVARPRRSHASSQGIPGRDALGDHPVERWFFWLQEGATAAAGKEAPAPPLGRPQAICPIPLGRLQLLHRDPSGRGSKTLSASYLAEKLSRLARSPPAVDVCSDLHQRALSPPMTFGPVPAQVVEDMMRGGTGSTTIGPHQLHGRTWQCRSPQVLLGCTGGPGSPACGCPGTGRPNTAPIIQPCWQSLNLGKGCAAIHEATSKTKLAAGKASQRRPIQYCCRPLSQQQQRRTSWPDHVGLHVGLEFESRACPSLSSKTGWRVCRRAKWRSDAMVAAVGNLEGSGLDACPVGWGP
eukprot:jgi/Botrbrau1/23064/Bobra.0243s0006.1